MILQFTVSCKPEPQGSSRGFPIKRRDGRIGVSITSANPKLHGCREIVSYAALEAVTKSALCRPVAPRGVPVALDIVFNFTKPHSAKKRESPVVKPDLDKLCRAVLDSLTGVIYADDAQVIQLTAGKYYSPRESVDVTVTTV